MKPNSGSGDKGDTSIIGNRLSKGDSVIDVIGTLDELNSFIGLARSFSKDEKVGSILEKVQNDIFLIGEEFAKIRQPMPRTKFSEENIKFLEETINDLEKELKPINRFILPYGALPASALHVARTVCRRCERAIVISKGTEQINELTLKYVNRLSDLLFTLARFVNRKMEVEEKFWGPEFP